MEVGLHANMCDSSTAGISRALHAPFKTISKHLSGDYGGTMKHLWIDFELIEDHTKRRAPWSFRFQKRVGSLAPDRMTGLPGRVHENVGHYSVVPDFQEMRKVPLDSIATYALAQIYVSTAVLIDKQKKLGGFDAPRFRASFIEACGQHGFDISTVGVAR